MIEYKFKIRFKNIIDLFYGVIVLSIFVILIVFLKDIEGSSETTLILVLISMLFFLGFGILPIIMFVQYYLNSRTKIQINVDTNTISINSKEKVETIHINEIETVEIYKTKRHGLLRFDFDYAKYFAKGKMAFIVTSLMTNDFFTPKNIEPLIYEETLPIIPKNLEESKTEYQLLLDKYDHWTDNNLEKIINSEKQYREVAQKVAREILNRRKNSA